MGNLCEMGNKMLYQIWKTSVLKRLKYKRSMHVPPNTTL